MLNKPIKEKELPELGDNLRYKDLKENLIIDLNTM